MAPVQSRPREPGYDARFDNQGNPIFTNFQKYISKITCGRTVSNLKLEKGVP